MIIAICDDQRRMLDKVYCYCKKIVQKKNAKYLSRDHTGSVDFGYRDAGSVWIGISKAATEK